MVRLYISSALIILLEGVVLFCGTSCVDRKIHEFNVEVVYHDKAEASDASLWYPERKSLFWVDMEQKKLFEYIPSENKRNSWSFNSKIGCIVPETKNTVILTLENKIIRYNLQDSSEVIIFPTNDENRKRRYSNGKCSPNGKLWVEIAEHDCEKETSATYCINPNGSINKIFQGSTADGMVWSNDKRFMYHNDSLSGLVKRYRYDIKFEEVIHNGAAVKIPKETGIPEGITIDKHDNLWIPQRGGFGVYCYNPYTGQLIAKVNIPTPNATSCTFGGENMDTLFITTSRSGLTKEELEKYPLSGSIFVCKIAPIGVKTFYFGGENSI